MSNVQESPSGTPVAKPKPSAKGDKQEGKPAALLIPPIVVHPPPSPPPAPVPTTSVPALPPAPRVRKQLKQLNEHGVKQFLCNAEGLASKQLEILLLTARAEFARKVKSRFESVADAQHIVESLFQFDFDFNTFDLSNMSWEQLGTTFIPGILKIFIERSKLTTTKLKEIGNSPTFIANPRTVLNPNVLHKFDGRSFQIMEGDDHNTGIYSLDKTMLSIPDDEEDIMCAFDAAEPELARLLSVVANHHGMTTDARKLLARQAARRKMDRLEAAFATSSSERAED